MAGLGRRYVGAVSLGLVALLLQLWIYRISQTLFDQKSGFVTVAPGPNTVARRELETRGPPLAVPAVHMSDGSVRDLGRRFDSQALPAGAVVVNRAPALFELLGGHADPVVPDLEHAAGLPVGPRDFDVGGVGIP
jgi:hypothetical protein